MEEVIEELPLELQQLLAREDPAVGVTERPGVVERAGVALAVDGDLRVVDVAGELRLVLVLLVFGLERLDTAALVLVRDEADYLDVVLQDRLEVVIVLGQQPIHVELRGGVKRLLVPDGVRRIEFRVDVLDDLVPLLLWEEHERVLVHRRPDHVVGRVLVVDDVTEVRPAERVHPPVVPAGVILEVAPDLPVEVGLARSDRPQEEFDALLGAESASAGFDLVDELVDRLVDDSPVEGVLAVVERIFARQFVLDYAGLLVVGLAVVVEHVRHALVGVAGYLRFVVQLL